MTTRGGILFAICGAGLLVTQQRVAPEATTPIPVANAAHHPQSPSPAPSTIGAFGQARGMRVGVAVRGQDLTSPQFGRTIVDHFTTITPENALKLGLHGRAQGFDWSEADAIAAFAQDHGLGLRLHTLVWEHEDGLMPGMSSLSPAACQAKLRHHIRDTIARYGDQLVAIDVVNEPLDEGGNLRLSRWTACLGTDPLGFAFHTAHEALVEEGRTEVALVLNEYGVLQPGPKADGLWRLVRDLRARGVPVDTVGVQAHIDALQPPKPRAMQETLERYAQAGLRVEITELDVTLLRPRADRSGLDKQQATIVHDVAAACLAAAGSMCAGVTSWGVSDDVHWQVHDKPGSRETPTLFDALHRPKPAYDSLRAALEPTVHARR